uniref:hybrid sensor histidine kinase/response regulator n=1 Tax=Methylobacterium sp. NMS12 TaxID=3079766 RepID=UPI003F885D49
MPVENTVPPEVGDARRLNALADYGILDTAPEQGFDDVVLLARRLCAAPAALVSFVAADRQWFKAKSGFDPCETSLDRSVCAHALGEPDMLVIPDLTQDPRTRDNPLVTGEPRLRFYAGAPLVASQGERLGSLCVVDTEARPQGLTAEQSDSLRALARQVMALMDLRRAAGERGRILAGQEAMIGQQNALIATQAAVSRAAGDRDAILDALVQGVMAAVPAAEGGVIEIREGDELVYRSGSGTLASHVGLRLPLAGSLSGHCLTTGKAVLCPDVLLDPRVKRDVIGPLGMRSALYVPVSRGGTVIGILKLQASRPDAFSGQDLRLAKQFAGVVAAGLAEAGEADARQDVRTGEATLRTVLDNLPVGVLIARAPSGRIVGHNAQAAAILGHGALSTDAAGLSNRWVGYHGDGSRLTPDDWPLARIARGEGPVVEMEVDYQRADGGRSWVGFSAAALHDVGGRLTGGVVVVSDIDARKRFEHQLAKAKEAAEEANRAKSEFLANMSHELRTPLSAVIGYSEMLQEEMEDAGQADLLPDMRKIEANARHLLGLINDVLDLSKIEAERMEVFVEAFEVEPVLRAVATTVEALVAKKGNTLDLDLGVGLGGARTDVTKLRQCLINLLSNAAKFTEDGTVLLSASRDERDGDPWLVLRVADTGIGMSGEQQARLFERFTQADASTTRRFGGTGLGLSITRAFARMLGGEVSVVSVEGEGTTFTLSLPADLPEPTVDAGIGFDAGIEAAATPSVPNLVLVVDDDASSRDLLARYLEKDGFGVVTAADGRAGLDTARRLRPRVILLDVTMPHMDGWSVLRALRADPDLGATPVVMTTVLDEQNRRSPSGRRITCGSPSSGRISRR